MTKKEIPSDSAMAGAAGAVAIIPTVVFALLAVASWVAFGSTGGFAHWWGWTIAAVGIVMSGLFIIGFAFVALAAIAAFLLRSK